MAALIKARILVPADAAKEQALQLAKEEPSVQAALEGKQILKEICVPGKLVNIVAK